MANVLTVDCDDPRGEGQGRCARGALAEQCAVVLKEEPGCLVYRPSLRAGSRAVPLLRDVRGRGRPGDSSAGGSSCPLSRTATEGRADRGRRCSDLPFAERVGWFRSRCARAARAGGGRRARLSSARRRWCSRMSPWASPKRRSPNPSTPRTRNVGSTTASASVPIRHVPTQWNTVPPCSRAKSRSCASLCASPPGRTSASMRSERGLRIDLAEHADAGDERPTIALGFEIARFNAQCGKRIPACDRHRPRDSGWHCHTAAVNPSSDGAACRACPPTAASR